ncbi:hypothetical protein F4803DRAFT_572965 [Xylaria telfairii]|nr:hypothetical protein F4803DRAFT_572965 [Xylaria telfairii]
MGFAKNPWVLGKTFWVPMGSVGFMGFRFWVEPSNPKFFNSDEHDQVLPAMLDILRTAKDGSTLMLSSGLWEDTQQRYVSRKTCNASEASALQLLTAASHDSLPEEAASALQLPTAASHDSLPEEAASDALLRPRINVSRPRPVILRTYRVSDSTPRPNRWADVGDCGYSGSIPATSASVVNTRVEVAPSPIQLKTKFSATKIGNSITSPAQQHEYYSFPEQAASSPADLAYHLDESFKAWRIINLPGVEDPAVLHDAYHQWLLIYGHE